MHTLMLRNRVSKVSAGTNFTIEVIGDSPAKEAVQASIRALEHHPARAARRSLIDILGIIEKHNFRVVFAEHNKEDDKIETWSFILQG